MSIDFSPSGSSLLLLPLLLSMDPPSRGQLRKVEKDKRKKQYHDLQVQGTNNSSIVSKRSVEMIYTSKLRPDLTPWFEIFVPKGKRRSPAINRGYWLRMESIKQHILKIVAQHPFHHIQVINLGCGFDPLPFQMLEEFPDFNIEFIDFDYPELVNNKLHMIEASDKIMLVIGESCKSKPPVLLSSGTYKLIGCDLKNDNLYLELLLLVTKQTSIKIFIAEVSLAYMKYEDANKIIAISSGVENSHFVILEQLLPAGKHHSFAQKMLYHFEHLSSPLQCVENYPTKADQISRFQTYYPYVEIEDLFGNWKLLVDDNLKAEISRIEQFDEWEEFIVFCQHYAIVHATNEANSMVYHQMGRSSEPHDTNADATVNADASLNVNVDATVKFDVNGNFLQANKLLELKFPAVCHHKQYALVHGGLSQTRSGELLACDVDTGAITKVQMESPGPAPRMCHTLTNVGDDVILIGGRGRPGKAFKDVYLVHLDNNLEGRYQKLPDLPQERYRHSSVAISATQILIFGGLQQEHDDNAKFIVYDKESGQSTAYKPTLDIPNLMSCGLDYDIDSNVGYISGGVIDDIMPLVNNRLYEFKVDFSHCSIVLQSVWQHDVISRIGCQLKIVSQHKVMVIGGVSTLALLNAQTSIVTLHTKSMALSLVHVKPGVWEKYPPALIGTGIVSTMNHRVTIIGGGSVCYSFGSTYNRVYTVSM